mmetsp:Transcript_2443/g.9490  ORF Transcript_2443/g.9490 Transcript_2443/m.9490 type:complete len:468 (-) Transcript_2443:70-1473(-)
MKRLRRRPRQRVRRVRREYATRSILRPQRVPERAHDARVPGRAVGRQDGQVLPPTRQEHPDVALTRLRADVFAKRIPADEASRRGAKAPGPRVPTNLLPDPDTSGPASDQVLGHAREHDLERVQRRPGGARRPRHRRRGSREVLLPHVTREEHRVRPQAPGRRQLKRVAPLTREEQALILRERPRISDGVLGEARRSRARGTRTGPGNRLGSVPIRVGPEEQRVQVRAGALGVRAGRVRARHVLGHLTAVLHHGVEQTPEQGLVLGIVASLFDSFLRCIATRPRLRHPVVHHLLQVLARVRTGERAAHGAEGREVRGADAGTAVPVERFHQVRERVNGDNPGGSAARSRRGRSGRRVPRRGDREGTAHAEPDREARRPAVRRPGRPSVAGGVRRPGGGVSRVAAFKRGRSARARVAAVRSPHRAVTEPNIAGPWGGRGSVLKGRGRGRHHKLRRRSSVRGVGWFRRV